MAAMSGEAAASITVSQKISWQNLAVRPTEIVLYRASYREWPVYGSGCYESLAVKFRTHSVTKAGMVCYWKSTFISVRAHF